jgi:uncharacterized protein with PQ loop repeat
MVEFAAVAGWAGGALVVARVAPQALRSFRSGNTAGVSVAGVWAWFANDLGWLVYGVSAGMAPLWLSSLVLLGLDAVLLCAFVPVERFSRRSAPGLAWLAAVVVAALVSPPLLVLVLLGGAAAGTVPHAWEALVSDDLSGVVPVSWKLGVADGALWLCYGVLLGDVPVSVYAALTLATSLVVLWRVRVSGRCSAGLPAAAAVF